MLPIALSIILSGIYPSFQTSTSVLPSISTLQINVLPFPQFPIHIYKFVSCQHPFSRSPIPFQLHWFLLLLQVIAIIKTVEQVSVEHNFMCMSIFSAYMYDHHIHAWGPLVLRRRHGILLNCSYRWL